MPKIIKRKKMLFVVLVLAAMLANSLIPLPAKAQSYLLEGIKCIDKGDCTVQDFMDLFINISKWILGIVGSAALLFFVIGGFMWIFSAGSEQRVTRGKQIIIGTVTGIILVFSGFMIIRVMEEILNVRPEHYVGVGECGKSGKEGKDCGGDKSNKVCHAEYCVSKCEVEVEKKSLPSGYACVPIDSCKQGTAQDGLCPDDDTYKCCMQKSYTPSKPSGSSGVPASTPEELGCCYNTLTGSGYLSCEQNITEKSCLANDPRNEWSATPNCAGISCL